MKRKMLAGVLLILLCLSGCMLPEIPEIQEKQPVFSSLEDLSAYARPRLAAGKQTLEFQYVGAQELTAELLAQLTCQCYVRLSRSENSFQMTCRPYPGDRMVRAWRKGTQARLSGEERQALELAEQAVEEARKTAANSLELEIALHDWVCENVDYSKAAAGVPDPDRLPRHLTALGALLDGKANCQGYTDCFYVLASLAGFEADRMTVETGSGSHIVNTLLLDGSWYVVDTTFDDLHTRAAPVKNYRFCNAGKDVCREYTWEPWMEYRPIRESSDEHYFYRLPEDGSRYGYPKCFADRETMAASVLEQYRKSGRKEFATVLSRRQMEKGFAEELEQMSGNPNLEVRAWYSVRGDSTYYYILLNP